MRPSDVLGHSVTLSTHFRRVFQNPIFCAVIRFTTNRKWNTFLSKYFSDYLHMQIHGLSLEAQLGIRLFSSPESQDKSDAQRRHAADIFLCICLHLPLKVLTWGGGIHTLTQKSISVTQLGFWKTKWVKGMPSVSKDALGQNCFSQWENAERGTLDKEGRDKEQSGYHPGSCHSCSDWFVVSQLMPTLASHGCNLFL